MSKDKTITATVDSIKVAFQYAMCIGYVVATAEMNAIVVDVHRLKNGAYRIELVPTKRKPHTRIF